MSVNECFFLFNGKIKQCVPELCNIVLTAYIIRLHYTVSSLITVEFLSLIKSRLTTNAQNILHL